MPSDASKSTSSPIVIAILFLLLFLWGLFNGMSAIEWKSAYFRLANVCTEVADAD